MLLSKSSVKGGNKSGGVGEEESVALAAKGKKKKVKKGSSRGVK